MAIFLLSDRPDFPPPYLSQSNGLLAAGGDLSLERLIAAYRNGIFPWYGEGEPILWWSPDPRLVLFPKKLHISRSLRRVLRKKAFSVTLDTAFREVITACARVRLEAGGETWIDQDMIEAYCRLHEYGLAHSVETWQGGNLCGGLYGVALGKCFFGESMFTRVPNASKAALVFLVGQLLEWSFAMIDCQTTTAHLIRMGAEHIPRSLFLELLDKALKAPARTGRWELDRKKAVAWALGDEQQPRNRHPGGSSQVWTF